MMMATMVNIKCGGRRRRWDGTRGERFRRQRLAVGGRGCTSPSLPATYEKRLPTSVKERSLHEPDANQEAAGWGEVRGGVSYCVQVTNVGSACCFFSRRRGWRRVFNRGSARVCVS